MVCRIDDGKAQIFSRNHKSWTKDLPHLATAAAELPVKQAIFDGEVVAFNANGTTDFQTMQNVFSENRVSELVYYAFDLLYLNGIDLRKVALEARKGLLEQLLPPAAQQTTFATRSTLSATEQSSSSKQARWASKASSASCAMARIPPDEATIG